QNDESNVYAKYFLFYNFLNGSDSNRISENSVINKSSKRSVTAYAIMHVYLNKTGGPGVTNNNKSKLSNEYGVSADDLRNTYLRLKKDENRISLKTGGEQLSGQRKRSADTLLNNFLVAIELLKGKSQSAHKLALSELEILKKE